MSAPPDLQLTSLERYGRSLGLDVAEYVSPTSRNLIVGNHRLHALDWGNDDKALVLLWHGHALSAHTWDLACLLLRPDFHCVAIDLRGHGDSEWSPVADYGPEVLAGDVAGVLDLFDQPAILIGMSMGGIAVTRAAATDVAGRVRGMVVVDIGPPAPGEEVPLFGRRPAIMPTGPGELPTIDGFVDQALALNPRRDRETLRFSILNNLRQTPHGTWTWKYDRRHTERMIADRRQAEIEGRDPPPMTLPFLDLGDVAPNVTCPTLVLRGAASPIFSAAAAEHFAGRFADASWVEVPDAGHNIQGDNPGGFVDTVRPFLLTL